MVHLRVLEAALELQQFCRSQGWRFCFIGGLAVQRWGRPRVTSDADLTLLTNFTDEERIVGDLARAFSLRRDDGIEFALHNRVLLLAHPNGTPLDIGLGALPFENRSVERSSPHIFSAGFELVVCSAEDLLVHKAFASRAQDWVDVENILAANWGGLDLGLVRSELRPLAELKESPDILDQLEARIRKLARSRYFSSGGRPPWETTPP